MQRDGDEADLRVVGRGAGPSKYRASRLRRPKAAPQWGASNDAVARLKPAPGILWSSAPLRPTFVHRAAAHMYPL
jgi:hypothetical protein